MTKAILVGYDPATTDRAPVEFGIAAARFTGAPLVIGSVCAEPEQQRARHGHVHEELAGEAGGPLDALRAELEEEDVAAEYRALQGTSPPGALHRAAEELGAGLLVIGSTGRGTIGRVLSGSTADRLLHGAPCPVAVVPHRWQRGGGLHVLGIAFVDTPEGHAALADGFALARRAGARVRVLTAVKPRHGGHKVAGGLPGSEATKYDDAGTDANAAIRQVLQERGAEGLDLDLDVSAQDPADFLVAASANVDLLICGSRGYGPQRAVLLGGVARKLTAGAQCPVIVLARGAEAGLQELIDSEQGAVA